MVPLKDSFNTDKCRLTMNTNMSPGKRNLRSGLTWLAYASLLPIVLGLWFGGSYLFEQRLAARQLDDYLREYPADDVWMAKRFRAATETAGTAAWSQILMLCESPMGWDESQLPVVGQGELPSLPLKERTAWREEAAVATYLDAMRPVLELIYASSDVPKPVWQPIQFRGVNTLLPHIQGARSVARLLKLEAVHASYHGDVPRTMAAIKGLKATAEVFDLNLFMVGELIHVAMLYMEYEAIEQSLSAGLWNAEQLMEQRGLLEQPLPIAEKWTKSLQTEAHFATRLDAVLPGTGILLSPRDRLTFFKETQSIQTLGDAPLGQLSQRAGQWETDILAREDIGRQRNTAVQMAHANVTPAVKQYAVALELIEYRRRLTLTAVALQQFKLAKGNWPVRLEELEEVGLSGEVWSIPSVGSFELEQTDGKVIVAANFANYMPEQLKPIELW